MLENTPECGVSWPSRRARLCGFAQCVREHAGGIRKVWRASVSGGGIALALSVAHGARAPRVTNADLHEQEKVKMARHKFSTILAGVLALGCVANTGFAQTQAATTNATQTAGKEGQSAAAMAQEASNPFASSWALQLQQNNNWTTLPGDTRVQSNLQFQPLLNVRLTEKQGLIIRPIVTIANSVPHFDQRGENERTVGFGDTVLAFALPRSLLGGRLMVGAGPTFIFPTASKDLLSQDAWQVGPDAGAVLLGKRFIAYAFAQQWFKVGGSGRDTNQMNGTFNFTYLFQNGWTLGTQPTLSVDWKARSGERGTFGLGPQVGKMCKCGGLPTLWQLQVRYLPDSSEHRRSEVEYSAAGDADDPRPDQEGALLTMAMRRLVVVVLLDHAFNDTVERFLRTPFVKRDRIGDAFKSFARNCQFRPAIPYLVY